MTSDLLDCFKKYPVGPNNIINSAIDTATNYPFPDPLVILKVFEGLGQCHEQVLDPNRLHVLDECFIVRYKLNSNMQSGPQFKGSNNYTIAEYRKLLLSGSPEAMAFVNSHGIIDELRKGLKASPQLISITDTSIHKCLITDGTRRLLGLIYLRCIEPAIYDGLDFSECPIKHCQLSSPVGRIFYPLDFWKLV